MSSERIAIVGAGLMGHGLAQVFACAGHQVAITDADPARLASVHERVRANLASLGLDEAAVERIRPEAEFATTVADADVVIEAVIEDLEVKRAVFAQLERLCRPDTILATNTSVMPVSDIGSEIAGGEWMVGTHWWNPPYLVPLVEVVATTRTSDETVQRMMTLLTSVGKRPVHVLRDVPGFVGNRLQHAVARGDRHRRRRHLRRRDGRRGGHFELRSTSRSDGPVGDARPRPHPRSVELPARAREDGRPGNEDGPGFSCLAGGSGGGRARATDASSERITKRGERTWVGIE